MPPWGGAIIDRLTRLAYLKASRSGARLDSIGPMYPRMMKEAQDFPTTPHSLLPVLFRGSGAVALIVALVSAFVAGCASQPTSTAPENVQQRVQSRAETYAINQHLALAASLQPAVSQGLGAQEYRVGPGDILEVAVFQVDELNRKVRVSGSGSIILPLLGEIHVGGMTAAEIEAELARELGAKYLRNPQVSVFVAEYRSQQITVMGAVQKPGVFSVYRPRSLMEMLSEAGGLSEEAGRKVYVQAVAPDPQTGKPTQQSLVVDLREVLESGDPRYNIVLHGGDSVHVPKAGVVFVEGAVRKPGAYQMKGDTSVLKAVAMAGGTMFEAEEGDIQVFRPGAGQDQVITVDLKAVRDQTTRDISLQDGDIIVVRSSALKAGFAGFWRGFTGIFSFGKSL
jgi:polysaccharide export outer membrane protein